jgi:hypothetical protein
MLDPEPVDLDATLPMTLTMSDGTIRKALERVTDFRCVRPWGLIVPSPFEDDGEDPITLTPEEIYDAAVHEVFGLRLLGVFPTHTFKLYI